jgi:3-deoxy-manno-octulosonate cytidylyltransferase (CMP-KDO synthetase)
MKILTLIPARLGSTRLPNKPLADILGIPMIVQVLQRAVEAGMTDIYVAAAEKEIVEVVEKAGARAILTDAGLPSGTDRIHQAFQKMHNNQAVDIIVNLQGDLPTIEPKVIKSAIDLIKTGDYDITTAVCEIKNEEEKTNPNVVKAIVSWRDKTTGEATNFTRETKPSADGKFYHHIGLYVYKRSALEKFVSLPQSANEKRERLEQLRALDNGMKIGVVKTDTVPLGVDTPEDLEKARKILGKRKR